MWSLSYVSVHRNTDILAYLEDGCSSISGMRDDAFRVKMRVTPDTTEATVAVFHLSEETDYLVNRL
jgi:hypothetical protein